MKTGPVILLSSLGLAAAGAAYYFLVYQKQQVAVQAAVQNISQGVATAQQATGSGLTLADLKAKSWTNPQGIPVNQYMKAYDPATGIVTHSDPHWTGLLLNPTTIQVTKDNGEKQLWRAMNGLGAITSGYNFI